MRVGFMGRTQMLLDTIKQVAQLDEHEVAFIWTSKAEAFYHCDESEFEQLATQLNCPFYYASSVKKVQDQIDFDAVDVVISINFINIIPQAFLERISHGVLNAHAGDLPRYKGNACPNWAIINGESQVVLSIHEMSHELDSGPIYLKRTHELNDSVYIGDIYQWLEKAVPEGFKAALDAIQAGKTPIAQDNTKPLRTFPRKPEDARIDWAAGPESVCRLVRASSHPFDGAFTFLNGDEQEKVVVYRAAIIELDYDFLAVDGQVLERRENSVLVASQNQAIEITDCQLNGLSHSESLQRITASLRNRLL